MDSSIKYKAWDKELKVMLDMFNEDLGTFEFITDHFDGGISLFYAIHKSKKYEKFPDYNEWKDRIVWLKWTGMEDKNGRKIHEGDILRYLCQPFLKAMPLIKTGIIEYSEKDFKWNVWDIRPNHGAFTPEFETDNNKFEIIGNKYENPDILENSD